MFLINDILDDILQEYILDSTFYDYGCLCFISKIFKKIIKRHLKNIDDALEVDVLFKSLDTRNETFINDIIGVQTIDSEPLNKNCKINTCLIDPRKKWSAVYVVSGFDTTWRFIEKEKRWKRCKCTYQIDYVNTFSTNKKPFLSTKNLTFIFRTKEFLKHGYILNSSPTIEKAKFITIYFIPVKIFYSEQIILLREWEYSFLQIEQCISISTKEEEKEYYKNVNKNIIEQGKTETFYIFSGCKYIKIWSEYINDTLGILNAKGVNVIKENRCDDTLFLLYFVPMKKLLKTGYLKLGKNYSYL